MEIFSRGGNTFFSRIISVCAVDGKKKKVLGAGGVVNQFLQICMDYSTLPDFEKITVDEIQLFYSARIQELCKMQKGE